MNYVGRIDRLRRSDPNKRSHANFSKSVQGFAMPVSFHMCSALKLVCFICMGMKCNLCHFYLFSQIYKKENTRELQEELLQYCS